MKCKIADINFQINCINSAIEKACGKYLVSENEDCDIAFSMTEADITAEEGDGNFSKPYLEYIAVCRKIAEVMPLHNAFLLHSAVFEVGGTGIAFAAQSGTGKTTHMLLWQRLLGDRLKIVNGDKPIVRFLMKNRTPLTPTVHRGTAKSI